MPRRVEAPINHNVHSTAREDGNARLIMAEWRLERFCILVYFDHSDALFHFKQSEHNRELHHVTRSDSERPLLDKFLFETQKIITARIKDRRFEKNRPINQNWLSPSVDVPIRRFDPSKVPPRSVFDRYKPFNPADHPEDEIGD